MTRDRTSITELTPLLMLERSADVFGDKTAITYRERSYTYTEMRTEVNRVARALQNSGIAPGE